MVEIYPQPGRGVRVFPTPGAMASILKQVMEALYDVQFWTSVEQCKTEQEYLVYVSEKIQQVLNLLDYLVIILKEKEEVEKCQK